MADRTLEELLRRQVQEQHRRRASASLPPPVYYLDLVRLRGGRAEVDLLPVNQIDSVRTMSSIEAATRFGHDARGGAVLIYTSDRR